MASCRDSLNKIDGKTKIKAHHLCKFPFSAFLIQSFILNSLSLTLQKISWISWPLVQNTTLSKSSPTALANSLGSLNSSKFHRKSLKHPAVHLTSLSLQDLPKALQPDIQTWGIQVTDVNNKIQDINLAEAPEMDGRADDSSYSPGLCNQALPVLDLSMQCPLQMYPGASSQRIHVCWETADLRNDKALLPLHQIHRGTGKMSGH